MKYRNNVPWYFLLLLILAGESVFILPFILPRIFRPTVLEVFNLDNIQLGVCFSAYGIVAMLSYFFGGPLADKYPPRKLLAIALWMTSLGGIVYAAYPSYTILIILYGYWGFTTIFLFWAPLIKATRLWGGSKSQGKAFGFLDGGRGLVGALFGTLGVFIFSYFIPEGSDFSLEESRAAFRQVILTCSALSGLVGVMVWFFMKMDKDAEEEISLEKVTLSEIRQVMRLPSVWLLMIIILCAYVGYKITDIFSLFAQDVMFYDQVQAAQVGTLLLYARPAAGILIGIIADRSQVTFWLLISFVAALFGAVILALGIVTDSRVILFFTSTLIVVSGVYAARALYYAVMEKGHIPIILTGTAVGLVSVVGYTPDIFAGPIIGFLLENNPGPVGHHHVFWMLAFFSMIGCVAGWKYYRLYGRSNA